MTASTKLMVILGAIMAKAALICSDIGGSSFMP